MAKIPKQPRPATASRRGTGKSWLEQHAVQLGGVGALIGLAFASYLVARGASLDRSSEPGNDGAAVQAYAAAGGLIATAVLVLVTALYVSLTERIARGADLSAAAALDATKAGQEQADAARAAVEVGQTQAAAAAEAVAVAQRQLALAMEMDVSDQARHIGGYIRAGPEFQAGLKAVTLFIVNSSPLPVRAVLGFLLTSSQGSLVHRYEPEPVIAGQVDAEGISFRASTPISAATVDEGLVPVLEFDDDAGRRWRKYETVEQPLVRAEARPRPWE